MKRNNITLDAFVEGDEDSIIREHVRSLEFSANTLTKRIYHSLYEVLSFAFLKEEINTRDKSQHYKLAVVGIII